MAVIMRYANFILKTDLWYCIMRILEHGHVNKIARSVLSAFYISDHLGRLAGPGIRHIPLFSPFYPFTPFSKRYSC